MPEQIEPMYPIDGKLLTELKTRFTYHKPKPDQLPRYEAIRAKLYDLAIYLCENAPDSRERSLALTHLDEVGWTANAAIARREPEA